MSQTVSNAVAAVREEPKAVAIARRYEGEFHEVLPEHIDVKQFIGSALAGLRKDPALLAAANNDTTRFVSTLIECARLGHVPGSREYYLTVRREAAEGGRKVPKVLGIEGYRGVIERMYRSGAVASVIVREVCEGDRFEFVEGVHDVPVHHVDWFGGATRKDPARIIGGYAYARLTTGATSRVVVLSKADFEETKRRSDAGRADKGPWSTDYLAMCLKTLAHRLEPWVPTSAEYRREQLRAAVAADAARSSGPVDMSAMAVDTETGEVIEAEVVGADEFDPTTEPGWGDAT